jgi:hypothetical protein
MNSRTDENQVILGKIDIGEYKTGWWIDFKIFTKLEKLLLRCKNFFERLVGLECFERGSYIVKNQFLRKAFVRKSQNGQQKE